MQMDNNKSKNLHRITRHKRVRAKITGTAKVPRISVFRSSKNIFVQFIDDVAGKTLLSNSLKSKDKTKGNKTSVAGKIGEMLAKKAQEAGIKQGVFDRGGFRYHGRVKALVEGLRQGGIKI